MSWGEETVRLDSEQFKTVEQRLNAIRAELQITRERLGPVDKNKSIHQAITDGFSNLVQAINESAEDSGKWQSILRDEMKAGFALVAEAIAKRGPGPPAKVGSVKFVFPGLKESE